MTLDYGYASFRMDREIYVPGKTTSKISTFFVKIEIFIKLKIYFKPKIKSVIENCELTTVIRILSREIRGLVSRSIFF